MTGADPRPRALRGRLRPVPPPDREPPHNLEAEEAVLGAVLAAGRLLAEVAALVEEADFYRPAHRVIWRAVLHLTDRDQPTDPVTVLGNSATPASWRMWAAARSSTPSLRPCPPWPTPVTTPSSSLRRPAAGG